ncbi:MAG TPA: metallophosphoesterase [Vicinamibacteria bacterium]|nr:metallophosphoesterase [Vicinamibacteria bacterium]
MSEPQVAAPRLTRKQRKRIATESLPIPQRRAYRAAQEVLEQGFDLWKMADNKTRLALMLLGPLNALLLALLANTEIFDAIPERVRIFIVAGVITYAALAMVMFLLAIGTLRPEEEQPLVRPGAAPQDGESPLGIRHYEDILRWDIDSYQRAWREVTGAQLVAELAEQAHAVAESNRRKYRALYYLFRGLQGMLALALVLVAAIGAAILVEGQSEKIRLKHGVKLTIPTLLGAPVPSPKSSEAAEAAAANGSGRDWKLYPAIVDRTTTEEIVGLGDVHGTYDRLVPLLEKGGLIRADRQAPAGYAWTGGKRTLVSVGDLIDKGPQSLEVLDLMMSLRKQAPAAGGEVIVTLGNHEAEFLAHPGKKKAIEFENELAARHIDDQQVASGGNDYGKFLLSLPLAARVNSWFFAHGGSTSGKSLAQLDQSFRGVVDSGQWKNPFLIGDDSLLEARKWWHDGADQKDLAALPAAHIVFGHDPGAFKDKGTIQTKDDGRIFLIDVGMTRAFDYSKGALLLIDRQGATDVATSLDAAGTRREVWRCPAPHGP